MSYIFIVCLKFRLFTNFILSTIMKNCKSVKMYRDIAKFPSPIFEARRILEYSRIIIMFLVVSAQIFRRSTVVWSDGP